MHAQNELEKKHLQAFFLYYDMEPEISLMLTLRVSRCHSKDFRNCLDIDNLAKTLKCFANISKIKIYNTW